MLRDLGEDGGGDGLLGTLLEEGLLFESGDDDFFRLLDDVLGLVVLFLFGSPLFVLNDLSASVGRVFIICLEP